MLKRFLLLLPLLVLAFAAGTLFVFWTDAEPEDSYFQESFRNHYGIYALPIPDSLSFAGEPVPIEAWDLRERFDREILVNTYWQSNTMLYFKRAHRWFPVIEPILAAMGVPDDFKYLALIESGLMNVVSPAGAAGYWQLLESTGCELGLEVNPQIDERYHVEKSTEAACRYLKNAHARFGSWTMAAAAYNLGNGGLNKQLTRQKQEDYYDLLLPEETSRYVFRILAMKEIIRDPERYGFHLRRKDLYPPYATTTVEVKGAVPDLADFALRRNTDYKTLKLLNPWLRDTKLTNKDGRTYRLLLPAEGFHEARLQD
jgi:hypothetical protein